MSKKQDEISLVEVYVQAKSTFQFIWSKKVSIIIVAIVGSVIGFVYATIKPIEYQSKLTFIVEQSNTSKSLGVLSGIASSLGFGGGGEGGLYNNQSNLKRFINSRSLIEKTYLSQVPNSEISFADRFIEKYGWRENWSDNKTLYKVSFTPGDERSNFPREKDSILYEIYKYTMEKGLLAVSLPEDDGSILALQCTFIDDTLSKFFPEILLNNVSREYVNTKTKLYKQNVDILKFQTDSVRNVLNTAILDAATETDQTFGLNPALNVKRVPATKNQVDIKASTVLLEELIKNLELAKVQLKDRTPLIEVIDKPKFPIEVIKTSKLKSLIIFGIVFGFFWTISLFFSKSLKEIKKKAEIKHQE